jgi:hypothetical protein
LGARTRRRRSRRCVHRRTRLWPRASRVVPTCIMAIKKAW